MANLRRRLEQATCLHRSELGRNLPALDARRPEENFPADACCVDRTLPRAIRDRCEDRAGARTILALLFSGRAGASNRPAKTSKEEILLQCLAIHRRRSPVVDIVAPGHLALIRVQSPRSWCGLARLWLEEIQRAAFEEGSRRERQTHKPG